MALLSTCPDFLIVGAMKSGTTTFHWDLAASPDVFIPNQKEPEILFRAKGPAQAAELYRIYFSGASDGKLLGEATTTYTMLPEFPCAAEIASNILGRNLQVFYIVRDPLERSKSHVFHDLTVGRIKFEEAGTALLDYSRYLDVSDYSMQISPWVEAFGIKNVHIVSFEEYVQDRRGIVNKVLRKMNCSPLHHLDTTEVRNERGGLGRPRWPIISKAVNSTAAQFALRGIVPDRARTMVKTLLTKRISFPPIEFEAEVLSEFQERLASLADVRQNYSGLFISSKND